jgi:predicted P-loop ATPase
LLDSVDDSTQVPEFLGKDGKAIGPGDEPEPKSRHNIQVALHRMGVELVYNEFDYRVYVSWTVSGVIRTAPLDDKVEGRLWLNTQTHFGFLPPRDLFSTVLRDQACFQPTHPIREYLRPLRWDGRQRIDRWLEIYGGASDSPFIRAISAIVLIAAVRRVLHPGCKFDEMLVLESQQGLSKSSAIAALVRDPTWFTDSLPLNASEKVVVEQTAGKWLVESADLSGITGADLDHLKSMLSRSTDSSRMAYDRHRTDRPRQFIVLGTTNESEYLRDMTGNRRFWPVAVQRFDVDAIARDRDQLWAEAATREAAGESIRLSEDLWQAAAIEQEMRRVHDPWEDEIAHKLEEMNRVFKADRLTRRELFGLLGRDLTTVTKADGMRLRKVMERLGWRKMTVTDKQTKKAEIGYGQT